MEMIDRLNLVFCEVFDDEEIHIMPEMTADDIDGWDSLSHVNLILAIESTFGIRFSQKELLKFNNVGDMMCAINSKI